MIFSKFLSCATIILIQCRRFSSSQFGPLCSFPINLPSPSPPPTPPSFSKPLIDSLYQYISLF